MDSMKLYEFNLVLDNLYLPAAGEEMPFTFRLHGTDAEAGAALLAITDALEQAGVRCEGGRVEVDERVICANSACCPAEFCPHKEAHLSNSGCAVGDFCPACIPYVEVSDGPPTPGAWAM